MFGVEKNCVQKDSSGIFKLPSIILSSCHEDFFVKYHRINVRSGFN